MKILKFLDEKLEFIGMSVMFVIMFVVVLLGIITRLIGNPISWTEEASRLAFVWMIFLGLSYGTAHDKHIRVTIIPDRMGPRAAAAITIFWDLVTIGVFIWIAYYGFHYVAYSSSAKTYALQINKGIIASIIPISACLNILRCVQKMMKEHIPQLRNAGKSGKGGK